MYGVIPLTLTALLLSTSTGDDPAAGPTLGARAVLLGRSESSASFLVVVENGSSGSVDVPAELEQYIMPCWKYAHMVGQAAGLPMCTDPDNRGTVTLGPGYSYGRRETIRLDPRVLAVAFNVDLGRELGSVRTPWVDVAKP